MLVVKMEVWMVYMKVWTMVENLVQNSDVQMVDLKESRMVDWKEIHLVGM